MTFLLLPFSDSLRRGRQRRERGLDGARDGRPHARASHRPDRRRALLASEAPGKSLFQVAIIFQIIRKYFFDLWTLYHVWHVTIGPDAAFQCASAPSPRGVGSPSAASAKKLLNCAVAVRGDGDDDGDNGGPGDATTTMTTPEQIKRNNDKTGESYYFEGS